MKNWYLDFLLTFFMYKNKICILKFNEQKKPPLELSFVYHNNKFQIIRLKPKVRRLPTDERRK